jgi:RNA-directed DNA polymerase
MAIRQVVTGKVSHVFETDIRSYFTRIDHQWLRRMVAHRIADPIILRLISKWLKAGALRDGTTINQDDCPSSSSSSASW